MARLLPVFLLAAMAHAQPALVGRWRSLRTSAGGIGSIVEFQDHGSVLVSPGAVVEMKYRIEGDRLILPPATTSGPEQVETMEWAGTDRLVLRQGQNAQTFSRRGKAAEAANPIVGEWATSSEIAGHNVEAHYIFHPSGNLLLVMPFTTEKGQYSLNGGSIRIALPHAAPFEGPFHIDGDILTIPNPTNPRGESQFRRY